MNYLQYLPLPSLANASFLEIGCGDGLICGYAWFEGARKVIGLDNDEALLEKAKGVFPSCNFAPLSGNFAKILAGNEGFDVIICSRLPEGMTFESILPLLLKSLNRSGTLILRAPLSRFPLKNCDNASYVYKAMGKLPAQDSSGETQYIFHIKHKAPYAILLMGESGSGKTTAAQHLFPNLLIIHGDSLMSQLATMPVDALKKQYPHLNEICQAEANKMTVGGIMIQIFNSAAGKEYSCLVASIGENKDFVYEGVIHKNFRHVFVKQLEALGYQVLILDTPEPVNPPGQLFKNAKAGSRKFQLYLEAVSYPSPHATS